MTQVAPYGTWTSSVSPQLVATAAPAMEQPSVDGENLYWLESRPSENGRTTIFKRDGRGEIRDILPNPLSASSRVYEYGGAPYLVVDDILYFVLQDDQRIYRMQTDSSQPRPEPLTPDNQGYRFADLALDATRQRLLCVAERHSANAPEPRNFIAAIPLDGSQQVSELIGGMDFYACPRLSPDQRTLAWLCWSHPQMPWDGSELWHAEIDDQGYPTLPQWVAGSSEESICQPQWSPGGELFFVSDRSNWWNLYRQTNNGAIEAIYPMPAEFSGPPWRLGVATYGFDAHHHVIAAYAQHGLWHLASIHLDGKVDGKELRDLHIPYSSIGSIVITGAQAWFIGASPTCASVLVCIDIDGGAAQPIHPHSSPPLHANGVSLAQAISFPTTDNGTAHGFYYAPCNPEFTGPTDARPPLIVMCHGGPTGCADTALNYKIQFWTSRGFAVVDINYRGSTGYGRRYREALTGLWGIIDVDDAVAGARHLIASDLANPNRMIIRGSSAGGFTVLAALTRYDDFSAGASYYGIGDLEILARDTHKFESRYLDKLIGPYPAARDVYRARSPIHHIDKLSSPVIFFQGLDDRVVPPQQAQLMVEAMQRRGLPVAYVPFPGEGHGFRKAANIATALQAELEFYQQVFALPPDTPDAQLAAER